ncbi:MAG: TolC family protein [Vicinamibacterales bacterium]
MRRSLLVMVCVAGVASAVRAQERPDASPVTGLTLASLVSALEADNPELGAARREIDMRVARISSAGAPPDPTVSVGYMSGFLRVPFFPSTATPSGFRQVGVSQEIPFPGKLALRSRIAGTEAEASRWDLEGRQRALVADLKSLYFEYQLAARSLDIVRRNRTLLDQYRQIAEAQFSVGKAIQQDVLRAQLEISALIERAVVLERQRDTLRARINALLYRMPDTPLDAELAFIAAPLPPTAEPLRAEALARYPAIRRSEQEIARGQQSLALARRELRPDFAVNVTTRQGVAGMPWMYGVDLMVTVPVFWQRKQRPMIAEAAAVLEAGRLMRDNTVAQAEAAVTEQYVAATSSRRLMDLYTGSVLPQARLALESGLSSYQVGRTEFLTVLTDFMSVLTYELSLEAQRAQYHQALARLEPLVGAAFIK